jgi:hypothetical protein
MITLESVTHEWSVKLKDKTYHVTRRKLTNYRPDWSVFCVGTGELDPNDATGRQVIKHVKEHEPRLSDDAHLPSFKLAL